MLLLLLIDQPLACLVIQWMQELEDEKQVEENKKKKKHKKKGKHKVDVMAPVLRAVLQAVLPLGMLQALLPGSRRG